jgi:hypothetical protein
MVSPNEKMPATALYRAGGRILLRVLEQFMNSCVVMTGRPQEGHMTTQSILFLTLVILGFGSFTAALGWAEYCSIHLDNRLGWRHLVK